MNEALIIVEYQRNPAVDRIEVTVYRWEGDPAAEAILNGRLYPSEHLKPGTVIMLGSLRLRAIRPAFMYNGWFVRQDGWRARWWVVAAPIWDRARMFKSRLIFTLAIWGLADWKANVPTPLPSWQQIKIIHAVQQWLWEARHVDTRSR